MNDSHQEQMSLSLSLSLSTASRPAMRPTQLVIQWVIPSSRIIKTMIDVRLELTVGTPTCLHSLVPYQAQGDITVCHLRNAFRCTVYIYVCVCVFTYFTEQSPSWEANRFSAGQEIPRIVWNTKVHYRIYKCLSLSWTRSIQSMPPHPTSWRSILILSFHLRLYIYICVCVCV